MMVGLQQTFACANVPLVISAVACISEARSSQPRVLGGDGQRKRFVRREQGDLEGVTGVNIN